MLNIHGRLWRSMRQNWKLLQLTREGNLMFLARGDTGFLSFNPSQKADGALFIVPYVLAHCIYVFSLFAQQVFTYATPRPNTVTYVLQLRNLENEKKAALLHPNHLKENRHPALDFYRPMPHASQHFSTSVAFDTRPGEIAYELVAQVFEWFGFDRDQVPDARYEDGRGIIDDLTLFTRR